MPESSIRKFVENLRRRCAKNGIEDYQGEVQSSAIHAYELEARILYSAAPVPVEMLDGTDANPLAENNPFDVPDVLANDQLRAFDQEQSNDDSQFGWTEAFGGESFETEEFIFIDGSVEDFQWMNDQLQEEYPDATVCNS